MAHPPGRKKRTRRRRLPRNIAQKTDREIMTRIFGKRVMAQLDKLTEDSDDTDANHSIHSR